MDNQMYDPWGVGEALRSSMRMFSHTKRATGRSTMLANAVNEGDTVVFAQRAEAQRMEREFRKAGKHNIKVLTKEPVNVRECLYRLAEIYDYQGQLWFDHGWFEAAYFYNIENVMYTMGQFIDDMEERRNARTKSAPIMFRQDMRDTRFV